MYLKHAMMQLANKGNAFETRDLLMNKNISMFFKSVTYEIL